MRTVCLVREDVIYNLKDIDILEAVQGNRRLQYRCLPDGIVDS